MGDSRGSRTASHANLDVGWGDVPIKVGVSILIVSIPLIDTKQQQFEVNFVTRLRTLNLDKSGLSEKEKEDWNPNILYKNILREERNKVLGKENGKSLKDENGKIVAKEFKYDVMGVFSEMFELKMFPFDYQNLSIVMTSALPKQKISLVKMPQNHEFGGLVITKPGAVSIGNFSQSNIFTLETIPLWHQGVTDKDESTTGQERPVLLISCVAKRRPGYYIWNVVVPHMLINIMTLSVFALNRDEVEARLSITVTMVLTSVAFKLYISDSLPLVSYNTILDWFVLLSFVFIACTVFYCTLASPKLYQIELTDIQDSYIGFGFIGAWALQFLLIVALLGYFRCRARPDMDSRIKQLYREDSSHFENRSGTVTVSKVRPAREGELDGISKFR